MIRFHPQFRRVRLDEADGFILHSSTLILCFHKGNASQAQTNTSLGAQTAGVAVSGNDNQANSGNQIIIGDISGSGQSGRSNRPWRPQDAGKDGSAKASAATASSPVVNATITNGLTSEDVTTAISALAAAFAPAAAPAAPAVTDPVNTEPVSTGFNFTLLQTAAAVVTIGGAVYLFAARKKKV